MADWQDPDAAAVVSGAETIDLQEEGSPGVLLLHGFGDTPQTLAILARRLRKSGYSVLAPLLPGHGRNMASFRRSRARDWITAAEGAYTTCGHHDSRVGGRLSMGERSARCSPRAAGYRGSDLIAPYLGMPSC